MTKKGGYYHEPPCTEEEAPLWSSIGVGRFLFGAVASLVLRPINELLSEWSSSAAPLQCPARGQMRTVYSPDIPKTAEELELEAIVRDLAERLAVAREG